jgi:uncharacterized protein
MIEERLDRLGATIEARHAAGRVRECHGDLHCRNLVRHNGHIVAFDCLEFEPAFRWIDVAEEIAFLFMDLCSRGGYAHARAFLNAWLASSGDYEAMRLIRLYGAHRALVRAKVAALEAADAKDADTRAQAGETHRRYIDCARSLLRLARPALVLVSGLSGSGKTWLSERLTFRGGAVHIRSDVERKRLSGRSERSSSGSGVGEGLYTPDMNSLTYSRLAECANHALAGGFTAVVDATFQRRADRAMFARLARDAQVPVVLVRCEAPAEVLRQRIVDRASTGKDASEANLQVLNSQQALFEPLSPEEDLRTIYADTTRATVVSDVQSELTASLCAGGKISGSASTAP